MGSLLNLLLYVQALNINIHWENQAVKGFLK